MTWESFFTGVFAIFIFVLMLAVVFALRCISQDEKPDVQNKKDKVRPKLQKNAPQPTSDQDLGEKKEILRTSYAGEITVQDAPGTFPEEEQQRFKNRQNAVSSDNTADIAPTEQSREESVFVLYEGHWAGKAENGEDKIFLNVFEDKCVITYEHLTRNCYATAPKEDVRTKVRYWALSSISDWSLEELLLEINQTFHLSINICDCCSEAQYRAWIEKHNTEFYSMEIMVDGTKQECMVRRVNEKSCEEIRFQGQTYFWKSSEAIHGLHNYDYAVEVRLNEIVYYLYHTEIPNKNDTLYWVVSQITESTFELLKHPPCDHEKIVFERKIGTIGGYEAGRRSTIYKVLALATGRTIGYYQADEGTRNICLEKIPGTVVPNDNHS